MKPTKTLYQSQRTRQRQKRKKSWIAAAVLVLIAAAAFALWRFGVIEAIGAALSPSPTPVPTPAATPIAPSASPLPAEEPPGAEVGEPPGEAPAETDPAALGLPLYELAAAIDDEDHMRATLRLSYPNATGETLYELVLRIYPNFTAPGSLRVNAAAVDGTLAQHILNPEGTLLTVPMDALPPGESCTLLLEFTFDVPESESRLGKARSAYQLGNFIPTLAVYENGAWDTRPFSPIGDPFYSGLADYKIAFARPAYYDAFACTGTVMEEQSGPGEQVVTYAAASAVRDFALVASGRLISATETAACGVTVTGWAMDSGDARRSARMGAEALDIFSGIIGPYPHDTLTIAETSISEGGMEYPGLIMIDRSLYGDGRSRSLEATIAHEAAHQWFYDAVGSDQIGAPWMDEALVNYLGILYFSEKGAGEDYERLLTANASDTAGLGWPIDGALYDYPDVEAYNQAVYQRGAFLFYALRETIGPEAFEDGVKAYYRDNAGKTARKADLIAAFSYAAERDLTEWFEDWLAAA